MKLKGFTLIELLAVIVILAIISLIAVPIALKVVQNIKMASMRLSLDNYAKAVENATLSYMRKNNGLAKNLE